MESKEFLHGNEWYNYYTDENTKKIEIQHHVCFLIECKNERSISDNWHKWQYWLIDLRKGFIVNHTHQLGKLLLKEGDRLGEITICKNSWIEFLAATAKYCEMNLLDK